MKRPSISTARVADYYASTGERIAEVVFPSGAGCLISCRMLADGTHRVEVYRADPTVNPKDPVREAAPDLLAALRRLVDEAEAMNDYRGDDDTAEAINEARAAIAKAEGQSP